MTVFKEEKNTSAKAVANVSTAEGRRCSDNAPSLCKANNITFEPTAEQLRTSVPAACRRLVNRCNLPAEALASLAFQLGPQALELDGVLPLHQPLFRHLDETTGAEERAQLFQSYMNAHFLLDDAPAQGLSDNARMDRSRLDYLRLLRGWLFDSEGREGAVLKAWVESRFGLLASFHRSRLEGTDSPARAAFDHEAASGLYGTGALEAQVDLLYAWAQYELRRRLPGQRHLTLYRGFSGQQAMEPLSRLDGGRNLVALNNLSSFSCSRERADEFGDRIVACEIPLEKVLAFTGLLPGRLQGEEEYLVIGGVVLVEQIA